MEHNSSPKYKESHFLYVGSFSMDESTSCGISICRYDSENGTVEYLETVRSDIIAGILYIDEQRGVLYAVDERKANPDLGGRGGGRIFAFSIDPGSGKLTELNRQNTFGSMPSFITCDTTGKYLLVSHYSFSAWYTSVSRDAQNSFHLDTNYSDCAMPLFPLAKDGSIGEPRDILIFPNEANDFACVHSVLAAPSGDLFAACLLKQARLTFLRLNRETEKLQVCGSLDFPRGDKPRTGHSPRFGVFHPTKPLFYFNSEYVPRLTIVRYDKKGGLELMAIQDVTPQLPAAKNAIITMSDLCLNEDGSRLYVLYRLINAICVFQIGDDGLPNMIQSLQLSGVNPRGLRLSPDGRFLLIANMQSEDVSTLAVKADGTVEEISRCFGPVKPSSLAFFTPSPKNETCVRNNSKQS